MTHELPANNMDTQKRNEGLWFIEPQCLTSSPLAKSRGVVTSDPLKVSNNNNHFILIHTNP